jgi:hypothetical protein
VKRTTSLLGVLLAGLLAMPSPAAAHHGWSSYETSQPLYLRGTLQELRWRNPHVEMRLTVAADVTLPPELPDAALPPQFESDGGRAILSNAALPSEPTREWLVVLAPIGRMESWGVLESSMPAPGASLAVVAYQNRSEPDEMRAEALIFADGAVIPLRRNAETPQPPRPPPVAAAPTSVPAPTEASAPAEPAPTTAATAPTEVPAPTELAAPAATAPIDPTAVPALPAPPANNSTPLALGIVALVLAVLGVLWFVRRRA